MIVATLGGGGGRDQRVSCENDKKKYSIVFLVNKPSFFDPVNEFPLDEDFKC